MLDRRTINVLLTTLAFVLAVALFYVVRTILVLFAFSILFAYLINPAVRVLQRYSLFFKDFERPSHLSGLPGISHSACLTRACIHSRLP
jgi:predicted PurR-regulated permease PerM